MDGTRRDFLYVASGAMGAVGLAAAAWPFIDQMNPSAAALALSSIEVDLSPVAVGQQIVVKWRGHPLFVRRRTSKEIEESKAVPVSDLPDPLARNANLPDSAPATDANRVIKPEWLILIGVCTHLGCTPTGFAGRLWWLAVPLPWLAIRHRRAASAKGPRRRIWRCRPTLSCPTPTSRSVEELYNVRSIDLYAQVRFRKVDRSASAAAAADA